MLHFPMPMIVGSPRSGTTLLRFLLDSHPDLAIPPETGFLLLGKQLEPSENLRNEFLFNITNYPLEAPGWADYQLAIEKFQIELDRIQPFSVAAGFRTFYRLYAENHGKLRWGDKTPSYCSHLQYLEELLPEARFIHIVRDGRDAAVSLRKRWFSPGHDIDVQAQFWQNHVTHAQNQGRLCRHYLELRFEDLINNAEHAMRRICSFIELEFHECMLNYYQRTPERLREHQARCRTDGTIIVTQEERIAQQMHTTRPLDSTRIGQWKTDLTLDEADRFKELAGTTLREYGYE